MRYIQVSPEERIISRIKKTKFQEAIADFFETFTKDHLPPPEFVRACFTEFNRQWDQKNSFHFMERVLELDPDDTEVAGLHELARKIYYDGLIVTGNKFIDTARRKRMTFQEAEKTIEALNKDKVIQENRKNIALMYNKALDTFQLAHQLIPHGLGGLSGIVRCYTDLGDNEEAEKYSQEIEAISQKKNEVEPSGEEIERNQYLKRVVSDAAVRRMEMERANLCFKDGEYDEVLRILEPILVKLPQFASAIFLKAKAHAEKREFCVALEFLQEAIQIDQNREEFREYLVEFNEKKLKLLTGAAKKFLEQAIRLGPSLGKEYFYKAEQCIKKGLDICPNDLLLLDQLYTCLIYLKKPEMALEVKRQVYRLKPEWLLTVDRDSSSSLCFLAGYAYLHDERVLTDFRHLRRVILEFFWGPPAIRLYIRVSPLISQTFIRSRIPPWRVRLFLLPTRLLAYMLRKLCNYGLY